MKEEHPIYFHQVKTSEWHKLARAKNGEISLVIHPFFEDDVSEKITRQINAIPIERELTRGDRPVLVLEEAHLIPKTASRLNRLKVRKDKLVLVPTTAGYGEPLLEIEGTPGQLTPALTRKWIEGKRATMGEPAKYLEHDPKDPWPMKPDLRFEKLVEKLKEAGVKKITLTGKTYSAPYNGCVGNALQHLERHFQIELIS